MKEKRNLGWRNDGENNVGNVAGNVGSIGGINRLMVIESAHLGAPSVETRHRWHQRHGGGAAKKSGYF